MTTYQERIPYFRQYRVDHLEKMIKYGRYYRKELHLNLIRMLGGICIKCGFMDTRVLQIDHLVGGGKREMRETFKGNNQTQYRYYLNHPEDAKQKLQVLCANCNTIKLRQNGEHWRYNKRIT